MAELNVICTQCGKPFHMKPYQLHRYQRNHGTFCSRACYALFKKTRFAGSGNHQYGLKGPLNASFKGMCIPDINNNVVDLKFYVAGHPFSDRSGRVSYHRHLVEQNHERFPSECFIEIAGKFYLRRGLDVHHIDGNHDNNALENLQVMTRAEHSRHHNCIRKQERDPVTGRFISNDRSKN